MKGKKPVYYPPKVTCKKLKLNVLFLEFIDDNLLALRCCTDPGRGCFCDCVSACNSCGSGGITC